jgi:hypothetical protein
LVIQGFWLESNAVYLESELLRNPQHWILPPLCEIFNSLYMTEEGLINEYYGNIAELSKLIKSWNLIKVSSAREFDKLSEKILKNLYDRQDEIKIKQIIESELCATYGLYITEFNSNFLTNEIMNWWNE